MALSPLKSPRSAAKGKNKGMEYEIELKLITSAQAGELIESQLLPQFAVQVTQHEFELSNRYYDTAARDFRKNGMGLRIRGCQGEFEQTIKTSGKGVAGLQQRPEYNIALEPANNTSLLVPDLRRFPAHIWPLDFNVDLAQASLQCLFTTHFVRKAYVFDFVGQGQIELVWDRGTVSAADSQETINELELELKQGDINLLFVVARRLAEIMPLKIGLLSKAARGYRLLNTTAKAETLPAKAYDSWSDAELDSMPLSQLNQHLVKYLSYWQKLANLFDSMPQQTYSALQTLWLPLAMLLARCSEHDQQLATDFDHFATAWQNVTQSVLHHAQSPDWSSVQSLLGGKTSLLLQLSVMQYLLIQSDRAQIKPDETLVNR